jgi:hypothetical protein
VRLKWGATEYHGRLISVDAYMNLQLHGTEEYVNGKSTGTLGQVLIRCVPPSWFLLCLERGTDRDQVQQRVVDLGER